MSWPDFNDRVDTNSLLSLVLWKSDSDVTSNNYGGTFMTDSGQFFSGNVRIKQRTGIPWRWEIYGRLRVLYTDVKTNNNWNPWQQYYNGPATGHYNWPLMTIGCDGPKVSRRTVWRETETNKRWRYAYMTTALTTSLFGESPPEFRGTFEGMRSSLHRRFFCPLLQIITQCCHLLWNVDTSHGVQSVTRCYTLCLKKTTQLWLAKT